MCGCLEWKIQYLKKDYYAQASICPIWVGHSAFLVSYYIFLFRVFELSISKKVNHYLHVWPSSYNFNMILISCPIPSCPHKSWSVVEFRISTTLKLWELNENVNVAKNIINWLILGSLTCLFSKILNFLVYFPFSLGTQRQTSKEY